MFRNVQRSGALTLALVLLAGAWAADPPQDDATKAKLPRLDAALAAKAPEVLAFLKKENCKSVGVLNFDVQRDGGKPSATVGPLNRRMADRLEVALALAMKDESVRLLRDVSDTVNRSEVKSPRPNHRDARGRKSFFKIKNYVPAWGNADEREKGMSAEVLLTGLAHVDRKGGVMNVVVKAFDARGKEHDVCKFAASTLADPGVLTEAGLSFARARGDDNVVEKFTPRIESPLTALDKSPVEFSIHYGDDAVTVEAKKDGSDEEAVVPAPRLGQKVTLRLKHRGRDKEMYGVVVKVNGESTIYPEKTGGEAIENFKWILAPGATTDIDGFQNSDKESNEFKVVPLSEAERAEVRYPDKFGTLEVIVFREKKKDEPPTDEPNETTKLIGRGKLGVGGAPTELKALQDELRGRGEDAGRGARGEGAIQAGDKKSSKVKTVKFEPAADPMASISIRYVNR